MTFIDGTSLDGVTRFPDTDPLISDLLKRLERPKRPGVRNQLVDSIISRSMGRGVIDEFTSTILSLRTSGEPTTVLGSLVLRDGQSTDEISARTGLDAADIEQTLGSLQIVGIVETQEEHGITRSSLISTVE